MRDPFATLQFDDGQVTRRFHRAVATGDFVASPLARQWVDQQRLVPFEQVDAHTVVSPRLPFVTHPSEWCDSQLYSAAELTLALAGDAAAQGFDLQDASAWNILFDGCRPLLCDLGSPQPLQTRAWWAAGQFARHFLLPLLLARRAGLHGAQCFGIWRDGVPPDTAARLIGPGRFLTRYWPLMARAPQGAAAAAPAAAAQAAADPAAVRAYRARLLSGMAMMLGGVRPRTRKSTWRDYVDERDHYARQASEAKHQAVGRWLQALQPAWVADLGCNTGEFSRLAASAGARVAAIDADHECVDALYRHPHAGAQAGGGTGSRLYPVFAPLDDLPGGRGMGGQEYPGLQTRMAGRFDMVLMLAVVHHLAVAAAVPLRRIADWVASVNRRWLVLELIGAQDPQLLRLCQDRRREPAEFDRSAQLAAFEAAGYGVRERCPLPGVQRELVLLERVQA